MVGVAVGFLLVQVSGDRVSLCFVLTGHAQLLGLGRNGVVGGLLYEVGALAEFAVAVSLFGLG